MIFILCVFLILNFSFYGFPRSVFVISFILMGMWMTGGRLVMRWLRERRRDQSGDLCLSEKRALIVGYLEDAEQVIRGLQGQYGATGRFAGIVTDEASAFHLTVRSVRVYGPVLDIGKTAKLTGANYILILPPYTRPKQINQLIDNCEKEGVTCTFQMMPSLTDMASGHIELSSIRKVELEDLLGRPEITFNRQSVGEMLSGKKIMITGAGGSIGSEMARQIAHYGPEMLILFDRSEFNLFTIDMELKRTMPPFSLISVVGDICHKEDVQSVLKRYQVQVLYHAAAYKHVPLMEGNVASCILNNTLGTARLVENAEQCGVERFVLISSDKAVHPTSVMGASKRLAERVIQERPKSNTTFVSVRFGNVLGSSGSVVPLFRKQIKEGGPVTVTTPNMTRFFMSIPEAVDLVLQASISGHDRDIMVLEMGKPIKIHDLARRMIELSGLKVDEDIKIVFTECGREKKNMRSL